jgi:NodT family efflux transporter outer membrane factor (OMF) lipoprotein
MAMPDVYAWGDDLSAPPSQPDTWWTLFGDNTLDALMHRASRDNFDVRVAVARVSQYKAQYGVARSDLYPDIGAIAQYTRNRTPGEDYLVAGFSLGGTPYDSWKSGLGASWELDLFGRIARSIEAAKGDLQAEVEDWRYALLTIRAEVAASYVTIRTLQARLGVVRQTLDAQQRLMEVVKLQYDQGTTTQSTLLQVRSRLHEVQAAVPELESVLASVMANCALLLGTTPGVLAEALPDGPIPTPPTSVTIGIPADLLRRRPDVRAAERTLAAATARIGEAEAYLYPQFTLSGQFGFGASSFKDMLDWSSRAYTAGPQVTWNVFNGDRVRSQINVQESLTREALLQYERTVIQAIGEVESALAGFVLSSQRRRELDLAALDARMVFVQALQRLEQGVTDLDPVITSQQSWLELEDTRAQAEGLAASSLVSLYRTLGGGWTPGELPKELAQAKESDS